MNTRSTRTHTNNSTTTTSTTAMCQNTTLEIKNSDSLPDNSTNTADDDLTVASTSGTEMTASSPTATDHDDVNDGNTIITSTATKDEINEHLIPSSTTTSSFVQTTIYTLLWILLTYTSKEFSKFLPYHQSQAGKQTFLPASYQYDDQNTYFDNTFLTYGTDFMICILMTYASYKCYCTNMALGYKGCLLFASYAISVFCGGVAHYTFLDVDSLNTLPFRIWWIVCVGSVTAAGGFMGMIGTELGLYFHQYHECRGQGEGQGQQLQQQHLFEKRFHVGHVYHSMWWFYGMFITYVCIIGEISYKRPACDIFAAGTTQFVPTMYCELMLLSLKWKDAIPILEKKKSSSSSSSSSSSNHQYTYINIPRKLRILFYVGFILNAPLLPSYPCLVQYTNLSLGVVNALLHTNLTLAWGMQAWSVYHICMLIKEHDKNRLSNASFSAEQQHQQQELSASLASGVGSCGNDKKYL